MKITFHLKLFIPIVFVSIILFIFLLKTSISTIKQEKESKFQNYKYNFIEITKKKLKEQVEIALSGIDFFYNNFKSGKITEEEAKAEAKNYLRVLRYDETNYFWAYTKDYILVVNPSIPKEEGTKRIDIADVNGKKYVKEFVDNAVQNTEKFTAYYFKKLTNNTPSEKMSFTKYYEKWQWVIGTGFYIDDFEENFNNVKLIINSEKDIEIKRISIIHGSVFLIMSGIMYLVMLFLVNKKILKPISLISNSLNNEDTNYLTTIKDSSGEFGVIVKLVEKVLKQKEELSTINLRLMEEKLKYKQMFDTNPAIKYILDSENGNIIEANQAASDFYGYSKDELSKMNISQINILPFDDILKELQKIKEKKKLYLNFNHKLKTGEIRNVEVYSNPFVYEEKIYINSIINDITDKLNYQNELIKINTTKDKFFSIIGHDLRGPIGNIAVLLDLFNDETVQFTQKEKDAAIKEIAKVTKSTFNLIEQLFTWARAQKGEISFNVSKIKLSDIVEECFSLLNVSAEDKKVRLVSSVTDDIIFNGDKDMLTTIIRNLLSNGIKFTKEYGFIKVEYEKIQNYHKIYVTDNGIGMTKEKLNKLFDIAENTTSLGTKGEKGSGLGLILCKEFVLKHNGTISVQSEVGKGSKFIVSVPI